MIGPGFVQGDQSHEVMSRYCAIEAGIGSIRRFFGGFIPPGWLCGGKVDEAEK